MSRKLSYFVQGILLISLVLAGAACGNKKDEAKPEGKAKTPVSIQLSWVHEPEFAGFYQAIKQGYYSDEGLDVQLKSGGYVDGQYVDPIAEVIAGRADFGLTNLEGLLLARAQGQPVVAISSTFQRSPRGLVSLADKQILTIEDLVGKKVVVRPDTRVSYMGLLNYAKINPSDVIEVTDPAFFSLDALVNGEVDAVPGFVTSEAILLEQDGHAINVLLINDYGLEDYQNIIFTRQDLIDEQPDMVLRFLRASLQGYAYVVQKPSESADLSATYAPELSKEFLVESVNRSLPLINPSGHHIGEIDYAIWQDYYQMMLAQGALTESLPIEDTYTLSFLEQIYTD